MLLGDGGALDLLKRHRAGLLAWAETHGALAMLGLGALHAAVVALSLPAAFAMTLAGGFLFGLLPGLAIALTASTIGATALFLAARHGIGEAARRRLLAAGEDGAFARIERGLRADETRYLLLMRLVPAVPFAVANVAPAFLGVGTARFAATTFAGIAPGTALTVWIGTGLGAALDAGGEPDLSPLADPLVLGGFAALVAAVALPILLRARTGRDPRRL